MPAAPGLSLRRGQHRQGTRLSWLQRWEAFFVETGPGQPGPRDAVLLAGQEDTVAGGHGFSTHPHRDVEIVTWVLSGTLAHRDSLGHRGELRPGMAQVTSAGTGITHSEVNAASDAPVRYVQLWVRPDEAGSPPHRAEQDLNLALAGGGLVPVAGGRQPGAALRLGRRRATLWAARLQPGQAVLLPDVAEVQLYLATGTVDLAGAGRLGAGDTARLTAAGGPGITAVRPPAPIRTAADASAAGAAATDGGAALGPAATASPAEMLVWVGG